MRAHLAATLIVTVAVLAWLAAAVAHDVKPAPIEVRLPGHFAFEPCDLEFRVRLQPVETDRVLRVVAYDLLVDPPMDVQHSDTALEGDRAAHLVVLHWRLDGGEYAITATIGTSNHVRASASQRLTVRPRFGFQ